MVTTVHFNDLFHDSISTVSYFWLLLVSNTKAEESDDHEEPKRKNGEENRKSSEDVEGDLNIHKLVLKVIYQNADGWRYSRLV